MSDSDLYDVPPPRRNEIPPSLPPKKSSTRSSFHDLDSMSNSQNCPDPRPRPKPRKTVRSSSNLSENATTPPGPIKESASPTAAPRPTPRPRPRKNSLKKTESVDLEENLPPSADEVEELISKELAQKEEEEQWKELQGSAVQVGENSADSKDDFFQNINLEVSCSSDKAVIGQKALLTDQDVDFWENLSAEKDLKTSPQNGDLFDNAFGVSDLGAEYAEIQKQKEQDISMFESGFDLFSTSQASKPGLPPLQPGMLQPTKVWDNPGYASSASKSDLVRTAKASVHSGEQKDSTAYEKVWYSEDHLEDKPGIVRPESELMVFTPKPSTEKEAPFRGPAYGECSGEYIELDPTYNVPPPTLPPPPLPDQVVVNSRPPSIPPRPVHRNPSNKPNPAETLIFQDSLHLSESSTEQESMTVFEGLPTPGFNNPFHDDDPFKNSAFDSECQVFNSPLSSDFPGASATVLDDDSSSFFGTGDSNSFVAEWPENLGESNNTYNEIDTESLRSAVSGDSDSSFRLSHVPPPPPRVHRHPGDVEMDSEAPQRETPSHGRNLYSFALTEPELRGSLDSSDSSEDMFTVTTLGENSRGGSLHRVSHEASGPIFIAHSAQPQKTERYGYLSKQGGVNANRGWRLRWVVFNGKDLRYYDNNRSQISKKIIPLSSMKEVIPDVKEGDTNRFKFRLVTTLRDRTFLFAADTRDDCCTWANVLMAAILKNQTDKSGSVAELPKADKEGFVRFENNNKKFYVAIYGKTLCYYATFEDFQMNCPVHEIDMKLSSVKDRKKNQLQLSTHYAHFFLMFDSAQETQAWRLAIEDAIAEGLADDSVLEKVYENDSNRICADCEDENPHWASINLGIVLCKKCAGIHRMFDNISKIRSLRMDTRVWTPSLIELMKAIGNGNANLFWENDLLPAQKLPKEALPEDRKQYALLKYQDKRYSDQHVLANDKTKLNEALLQVATTNDLLEAMRIIFSGADLSYVGGPERENAYQIAKRHGQRLLMELLYQNGGDRSSLDGESISDEGRLREDVRLQGHLMKTGPAGRTFEQRWCVLEHGALTYYLNEKSTTAKDSIDRRTICCLEERQDNVFEISTTKGGNRVYTFGADNAEERGMWMRTLAKLVCPVAVMDHVGMMDFSLAAQVYMRESVSEDWRQSWIMVSWRLLYYMDKDLKLDHVDLRKAMQIRSCSQSGSCPKCTEKGAYFVLSSPGQTFYIQANLQRDTNRILEYTSALMKQSGPSLLDQQLTADNVPVILDKCLAQVYSRAQKEEGIYRKAATNSRVVKLIQDLKTDAHAVRLEDYDVHEVANSLKRFLRELDDSLFMQERYNEWIRTSLIDDHRNKMLWYRYLLEKMPSVNYSTLRRIVMHIWKMAQNEQHNRMNMEAFCTCFAPTLMRTGNTHVHGNNPGNEIKVLLDLVSQRDYLFQIKQDELDHEAKMQEAAQKIMAAQQGVRNSQTSNTFLMPVSMYSHNGQCEMVNTTQDTSAQDVVNYLVRKCNLSNRDFCLSEIIFKGALVRPLLPSTNILMTTGRWGDWEQSIREDTKLCLTDREVLDKLFQHQDMSRPLFGEVKFADPKSKTKFKKVTVEFKQCVLYLYKDAKAKHQLVSWKVEDLCIYLGIDSKRSPPSRFGFTFVVNSKDQPRYSSFGYCVSLTSEDEMYRWTAALLGAQQSQGLGLWGQ